MTTRQIGGNAKTHMEKMDRIDAHVSNVKQFFSDCSIEQKHFHDFIVKHLSIYRFGCRI